MFKLCSSESRPKAQQMLLAKRRGRIQNVKKKVWNIHIQQSECVNNLSQIIYNMEQLYFNFPPSIAFSRTLILPFFSIFLSFLTMSISLSKPLVEKRAKDVCPFLVCFT